MLEAVFCDIDGCMGDFVKPQFPLPQKLDENKECLEEIRKKVVSASPEILFGVCTGRGFYEAFEIMCLSGHTGPSVLEMGAMIFDENEGGYYNLFEHHERFRNHHKSIQTFIQWRREMADSEFDLKQKFSHSGIRQIKTRTSMLTYEFDKDISKELFNHLLETMPSEVNSAIDNKTLKVLISKNALDILPNISKGDAVEHLLVNYRIDRQRVLAIGDSNHSDLSLLNSAGRVACPKNADDELKQYVLRRGGFVAQNKYSEGLLEIYNNFL